MKCFDVGIIDDIGHEPTEHFFIDLKNGTADGGFVARLGDHCRTEVSIIDDDVPGEITFALDQVETTEKVDVTDLKIIVKRLNGSNGKIGCTYYTEDGSAKA